VIQSATGVQQGDPLGPLLFCMTMHPVLSQCDAEIRIGYLDDVTLGGSISSLSQNVEYLKEASLSLGLVLNNNKCEFISNSIPQSLPSALQNFLYVNTSDAILLGSPILRGAATQKVLGDRVESLKVAADRLKLLQAHDALTILKHSLSLPSLLHILRSSPCADHASLEDFDETLRICLSQMLNVTLNDQQWMQASLPVKDGGLGIRRAAQVAPSAFLASASAAALLITSILPSRFASTVDTSISQTFTVWSSGRNITPPPSSATSKQKEWDRPIVNWQKDQLLSNSPDEVSRARLLAVFSPHSGDWLNSPPLTAAGLRMSNETIRIATGLRLGAALCAPHNCSCGASVDARGIHGLSCRRSAGRHQKHAQLNDIIHRALTRAGIAAVKEPSGTVMGSGLRPDGASLIPWTRGKCLAWDATSPDTLAASHISSTSIQAGAAAEHAASSKILKYTNLGNTYHFVPVAVETLGAWNAEGRLFINDLGRRMSAVTGDARESNFLFQRISVAVQRGNAASVLGSLPSNDSADSS